MKDHQILILSVLLFCAGFSFFLSGMEAGVLALSRLRIRQLKRSGNARAAVLYGYLENPEVFLWTILVGNSLANLTFFCLLILSFLAAFEHNTGIALLAFFTSVFLFFVFCELVPKTLFRLYPNRLCLILVGPFRLVHLILSPVVGLVEKFSYKLLRWSGGKMFTGRLFANREELRFLMQDSAHSLSKEERTMINRVLDLHSLMVRSVAIPIQKAITFNASTPVGDILKSAVVHPMARFPIWNDEKNRIVGILDTHELIYGQSVDPSRPASSFLRPALFLNENLSVEEALRTMQRTGKRMAVVLNGEQKEIAIVTLHDALRLIFGEVSF